MPYATEILYLLDISDPFNPDKRVLQAKADMIQHMGNIIDLSGIEESPSYEDFLKDARNSLLPLSEIADEVLSEAMECFKKKT